MKATKVLALTCLLVFFGSIVFARVLPPTRSEIESDLKGKEFFIYYTWGEGGEKASLSENDRFYALIEDEKTRFDPAARTWTLHFSLEAHMGKVALYGPMVVKYKKAGDAWALTDVDFDQDGDRPTGEKPVTQDDKRSFDLRVAENIKKLTPKAEEGDLEAQCRLGILYSKLVHEDEGAGEARKNCATWLLKAAEKGHAVAQYELTQNFAYGWGVPQSYENEHLWALKAAKQGHGMAARLVGIQFSEGRGVAKDEKKSFEWFSKAVESGVTMSNWDLAYSYEKGRGVPVDLAKALECYRKGAIWGSDMDLKCLFDAYCEGKGCPRNPLLAYMVATILGDLLDSGRVSKVETLKQELTKSQLAEAERLARGWKLGTPLPSKVARSGAPKVVEGTSDDTPDAEDPETNESESETEKTRVKDWKQ